MTKPAVTHIWRAFAKARGLDRWPSKAHGDEDFHYTKHDIITRERTTDEDVRRELTCARHPDGTKV